MIFEFSSSNTQISQNFDRLNYFELFGGIGSILYTLRSISNGIVHKFSDFTVDHSLIKKLYSVDRKNFTPDVTDGRNINEEQRILKESLDRREGFKYSWRQYGKLNGNCSCCCRRCRKDLSDQDKLFQKAKKKLHNEIDLVYIVRLLRIASFTAMNVLKPH